VLLVILACVFLTSCGGESEIESGSPETAENAAAAPKRAEAETPTSEQVKGVARALDPSLPPEMRLFAVQQLVIIGTDEIVAPLATAIGDDDERVALAAIEGLPDTTDPVAIAALEYRAANGPETVSQAAKRRLSELQ